MEPPYTVLLAAFVAGILTYCDLDTVFDAPPHKLHWSPWIGLRLWWWGFVLANAVLAGFLYHVLRPTYFKEMNNWLASAMAGASFTALVRLKFTTLPINGKNTPIGIETFYEGLKGLVHRRINRIIRAWRMEQCEILAQAELSILRQRALTMVGSDALLADEQRNSTTTWIEAVAGAAKVSEGDRKRVLAIFIITEQRTMRP